MEFGPLSQMLAMNPYLLGMPNGSVMHQLMGAAAAGLHQGWAGGMAGKPMGPLWNKEENKVLEIRLSSAAVL